MKMTLIVSSKLTVDRELNMFELGALLTNLQFHLYTGWAISFGPLFKS